MQIKKNAENNFSKILIPEIDFGILTNCLNNRKKYLM